MSVGTKAGQEKTEGKIRKIVIDKYLLQPRFSFNKPQSSTDIMIMLISYITNINFFTEDNMKGIHKEKILASMCTKSNLFTLLHLSLSKYIKM
jgi:hypothetical protein